MLMFPFLGLSVAQFCDLFTLRNVLYVVGAPPITNVDGGEDVDEETFQYAHKLVCKKCVRRRCTTFGYL